MAQIVSRISKPQEWETICMQIGSPRAFLGTPAHLGIPVPSMPDRQLDRFEELLLHERCGIRQDTFPQAGQAHPFAPMRSAHLALQYMGRALFLPLPFH